MLILTPLVKKADKLFQLSFYKGTEFHTCHSIGVCKSRRSIKFVPENGASRGFHDCDLGECFFFILRLYQPDFSVNVSRLAPDPNVVPWFCFYSFEYQRVIRSLARCSDIGKF